MPEIDLDELSDEEIQAILNTTAFQKSLRYRRLAQGIEVLEEDDSIYRQLVARITADHSTVTTTDSVEEVLDLFVEEVKTYTEGMALDDGDETGPREQSISEELTFDTNEQLIPDEDDGPGDLPGTTR